jgi:chaperone modulatory protein CbpM
MSDQLLRVTVQELCDRQGIARSLVVELVEHEIARPLAGETPEDWVFDAAAASWVSCALRLRRDLELDWVAVAMLIDLLREREQLTLENARLRRQLARYVEPCAG